MDKTKKPKRRLVDLSEFHYLKLETYRGRCRRVGKKPPSVPTLVSMALDHWMETRGDVFSTK